MHVRQVLRRGNLLIARAAEAEPNVEVRFICECVNDFCLEAVLMTPRDFRVLTEAPGRFVISDGHEEPTEEEVVAEGPGYTVVEVFSGALPGRWGERAIGSGT
jgi:hypothetical protein